MFAGTEHSKQWISLPVAWLLLTIAIFLPACALAVETPAPTSTLLPVTPPPVSITPTSTATPLPSTAVTKSWIPTPFPNSLEAFSLVYNPAATLALPPQGSIHMIFWGGEIPVRPVNTTPEFISFPSPQSLEHTADPLAGIGCELDTWGWATCPLDNPLQHFGCDFLVTPRGIGSDLDPDTVLVAKCLVRTDEYETSKINGVYLTGCAFRTENRYIFEIDGQYVLVSSADELKQQFTPINSPQEAVSYAQLVTGLQAIYSFNYDPTLMYFQETITATRVIQSDDVFKMNLFSMDGCGCEPWFTTQITIQVDRAGQVTWLDAVPIFMTTGWSCAD